MIIIGDKYTTYEIDENIEKKYKIVLLKKC